MGALVPPCDPVGQIPPVRGLIPQTQDLQEVGKPGLRISQEPVTGFAGDLLHPPGEDEDTQAEAAQYQQRCGDELVQESPNRRSANAKPSRLKHLEAKKVSVGWIGCFHQATASES